MRLGRDVGGLLVALHAAAEDAVDAVGLGEDGRVADRQAGAEAQAEHCGKRRTAVHLSSLSLADFATMGCIFGKALGQILTSPPLIFTPIKS